MAEKLLSLVFFECEDCKKSFSSAQERLSHRITDHLTASVSPSVSHSVIKRAIRLDQLLLPWRCKVCGERFSSEISRDFHFCSHGSKPFKCPRCELSFEQELHRKNHIKEAHGGAEDLFACETCGLRFACCCDLHRHAAVHARPYVCPECGEQLETRRAFNSHLDAHMNVLPLDRMVMLNAMLVDTRIVEALGSNEPPTPTAPVPTARPPRPVFNVVAAYDDGPGAKGSVRGSSTAARGARPRATLARAPPSGSSGSSSSSRRSRGRPARGSRPRGPVPLRCLLPGPLP